MILFQPHDLSLKTLTHESFWNTLRQYVTILQSKIYALLTIFIVLHLDPSGNAIIVMIDSA